MEALYYRLGDIFYSFSIGSTCKFFVTDAGIMEISLLKVLVNGISSFLHISFSGNMNSEPVTKYYQKAEEILKLLKPIIDVIVNSELASEEVLCKLFEELGHAVDELREHIENWHLLSSKLYFVSLKISQVLNLYI